MNYGTKVVLRRKMNEILDGAIHGVEMMINNGNYVDSIKFDREYIIEKLDIGIKATIIINVDRGISKCGVTYE